VSTAVTWLRIRGRRSSARITPFRVAVTPSFEAPPSTAVSVAGYCTKELRTGGGAAEPAFLRHAAFSLPPRRSGLDLPVQLYREAVGKDVNGLRLGILQEGFTHPGAQDDVNTAVRKAASQLQRLGAKVEELSIPEHRDAWQFLWPIALEGMAALAHGNLQGRHKAGRYDASLADFFGSARLKQPVTQAITVKFVLSAGQYLHERYHGRLYAKAQNLRGGLRAKYDAALQKFDALVMPSTPMKSNPRNERAPYAMLTNTAPFDVTGHPGLSIPCGISDGLPIGLMLIGRHFDDAALLRLGFAYEQSVDWQKI